MSKRPPDLGLWLVIFIFVVFVLFIITIGVITLKTFPY